MMVVVVAICRVVQEGLDEVYLSAVWCISETEEEKEREKKRRNNYSLNKEREISGNSPGNLRETSFNSH